MTTVTDLNAFIAEHGYTRGIAELGRMVLTGRDVVVAEWDHWFSYAIIPFTSEAEAEAYVRRRAPVSHMLQNAMEFEQHLADTDGPRGYGW